jgi:twitching motility protein PilJ
MDKAGRPGPRTKGKRVARDKPKSDLSGWLAPTVRNFGPGFRRTMGRWMGRDLERVPLLNRFPVEQRQSLVVLTLLVSLPLAALLFAWNTVQVGSKVEYVAIATRLQMLSQRCAKAAQQAVRGNETAFVQLKDSRRAFVDGLNALIDGGAGVPASPGGIQPDLARLKQGWEASSQAIETLEGRQPGLVALAAIAQRNSAVLDLTKQVTAGLPNSAGTQLESVDQLALWSQRMANNANALLSADLIQPETAQQLSQDARSFREGLDAMLDGGGSRGPAGVSDPAVRKKLLELRDAFASFDQQVKPILKDMPQLAEAKRAAHALLDESEPLLAMTEQLTARYQEMGTTVSLLLAILFSLLALAALLMLGEIGVSEARRRAKHAAE